MRGPLSSRGPTVPWYLDGAGLDHGPQSSPAQELHVHGQRRALHGGADEVSPELGQLDELLRS
jgi:hypothetical protein